MKGSYNHRPCFQYSSSTREATIKWSQFTLDGSVQMAWLVTGTSGKHSNIRFVSFCDVNDPQLAYNWMYLTNENMLINAPHFLLFSTEIIKQGFQSNQLKVIPLCLQLK